MENLGDLIDMVYLLKDELQKEFKGKRFPEKVDKLLCNMEKEISGLDRKLENIDDRLSDINEYLCDVKDDINRITI